MSLLAQVAPVAPYRVRLAGLKLQNSLYHEYQSYTQNTPKKKNDSPFSQIDLTVDYLANRWVTEVGE